MYIILHHKLDCDVYFCDITFLEASYSSSKGQKVLKIANLSKIHPEAANLHREIISHEKFDTVTSYDKLQSLTFSGAPWESNVNQTMKYCPPY